MLHGYIIILLFPRYICISVGNIREKGYLYVVEDLFKKLSIAYKGFLYIFKCK